MAAYQIKKSSFGEDRLLYKCPKCASDLESKLSEAGSCDDCPICGGNFVVPGQDEVKRREAEAARRAGEDAQRKREEERRAAAEAEQRRIETIKRDAEKKLRRNMAAQSQQEAAVNEVQEYTVVDRLLRLFFKLGRVASVVILVFCAVASIVMGVLVISTEASKPASIPLAVQSPTVPDYEQYNRTSENKQAGGAVPRPRRGNNAQLSAEANLCQKYGLEEDTLVRLVINIDPAFRSQLCMDLDAFLAGVRDKSPNAIGHAAMWFIYQFDSNLEEAKQKVQDVDRRITQARTAQWAYLTVILGCFAAALGFLVLPLLIQIERNTRNLLAR